MDTGNFLAHVHEGMKVFDSQQHEIGTVDYVKMSDDNPATDAPEQVEARDPAARDDSLIDNIADVFAPDDLPEEIRDRLLQGGFLRIDSKGLLAADRYIMPSQISTVAGDAVTLNVSKDELLKKH
jgi:hypothetical protein